MQHIIATAPREDDGETVTYEFYSNKTDKGDLCVIAWRALVETQGIRTDIAKMEVAIRPATVGELV